MGAVEQEYILKSSEQFELDKAKMIDEQKKEISVFNDKVKEMHKSMLEKDMEIEEWKRIAEDNIKKTGNSSLRDLKLKTKEVETLKRQVDQLKNGESTLKKKNRELEKEIEMYKKSNKLPRDNLSRGRQSSQQNCVYSRGSSRKGNPIERNRSRSNQSNKSGGFSPTTNNVKSYSYNKRTYNNNYINNNTTNSREKKPYTSSSGYNVKEMKFLNSSSSKDKVLKTTSNNTTNF